MTYSDPTCSHLTDKEGNKIYARAYRGITKGDLEKLRYVIYGRKKDETAKVKVRELEKGE